MRTALDTNILSAILSGQRVQEAVRPLLLEGRQQGRLVISGTVYSELLAHPDLNKTLLDQLLELGGIRTDFEANAALWHAAGQAYSSYAKRRRTSGGGAPRRILPDFLIGAHAALHADALMTLDPQHYRLAFPNLRLIVPR